MKWIKADNDKIVNLEKVDQIRVVKRPDLTGPAGEDVYCVLAIHAIAPLTSTIAKGSQEVCMGILEKLEMKLVEEQPEYNNIPISALITPKKSGN